MPFEDMILLPNSFAEMGVSVVLKNFLSIPTKMSPSQSPACSAGPPAVTVVIFISWILLFGMPLRKRPE